MSKMRVVSGWAIVCSDEIQKESYHGYDQFLVFNEKPKTVFPWQGRKLIRVEIRPVRPLKHSGRRGK